MILTPLNADDLPDALTAFARTLHDPDACRFFARLARPQDAERASAIAAESHRHAALALAASQDMRALPGSPAAGFSWDGKHLRAATEAYVLVHEVAHFQLAAPARRGIIDFGLGAGPETGERAAADRAARVFGAARETEEAMASLLGIAWEVELGQPGLASFLDQNWLEGAGRPSAAAYFEATVRSLRTGGFLDAMARPTRTLRNEADPPS
jgi:hypothetical protein